MGMYDNVIFEGELPGLGIYADEMQSKSLDCLLATYRIAADGQLYCDDRGWGTWGEGKPKPEPLPVIMTGEVRFYTARKLDGVWPEFSAYFVKGKLKELHRLDQEVSP